ncbi:SusC/RagA family TonB-linked outer membrane protein [Zunongwangia sp. HRR-M8]|uniref:SusC/RagA family TonB-linked outer membrane protein n=1 Tax=Zunongwangia sp. HRR-M8 TaxID=3015170 RepID=UPI0022DE690A|nr:SusC/RagA family TonB-linked outer membrane protein [Zunongwangia sp. HRR-M8]WBL21871.1 SusC/RagA family TonB-linked outer membrane protein [Zunongwangia sp. HRR-M8]
MNTKLCSFLTLFLALIAHVTFAQEKTVSGTVTDDQGLPLPGVTVLLKGTNSGTQTDFDGNYSITAIEGDVLVYSFIGMQTVEYTVQNNDEINITLETDSAQLDEVVVTALGIEREKKSLGYATQEVAGNEVSDVPQANFVNSLQGKVSGLQVKPSGTMGGSSNTVIRGFSSLTGSNQALYVIDGTIIDNSNNNTSDQQRGGGGYDYGNAATDINPEDIKSINVLKGAAASALYGSRASNGAIIIETKKGAKRSGIGISINSTIMVSEVNNNTLPEYQKEYGAGYGAYYDTPYFNNYSNLDLPNGFDPSIPFTPFTEDASYGAAFDGRPVYQWNSIYPQLEGTYQQATPWLPAENDPNSIWKTGTTAINSFALSGGGETNTFRLSVTNFDQEGNLPNSSIKRNTVKFSASQDIVEDLSVSTNISYIKTDGKGRYGTGYSSENPMQQFRQWWQTNVDLEQQKQAYFDTKQNITWNPNSPADLSPIYSNNPYWTRYENYQTDTRNRYFGNFNINYSINDVFSVLGRFTFDTYDELREERRNVGSDGVSGYSRYNNRQAEYNYDLILNFNKDFGEDFNLDGNIGWNLRRNEWSDIRAETNGGLRVPGLFSLSNTSSPLLAPDEYEADKLVDGIYARASVGFKNTYYIEGTIRRDRSSSLPSSDNTYYYPSISGNILLSNLVDADWLNFTKLRANYAEVGADTNPYRIQQYYSLLNPYGDAAMASNISQINNANLKPERSKAYEFGIEADFFDRRLGLDVTYYNSTTEDLITPVDISNATGFNTTVRNAGSLENKGWEVQLRGTPIQTEDFSWNISANWTRNRSEVISLDESLSNLPLASLQGGITIDASPGQPYGAIRGTDYIYDDAGNKVVGDNGYYLLSETNNEIIGNVQPDWIGGVQNTFKYKNISLSVLIDGQKGGDIYSLDTWYGMATGLYPETVGTNDLGNPKRNTLANGGGIVLPGVTEDGQPNRTRVGFDNYNHPYGYGRDASKGHVYDASFVKLREVNLTYSFGEKIIDSTPLTNASISLIGRNLWIIHKNIPYSDPEAGLSSGNVQGYQSGAYPSLREVGASLKLNF